jgi:hypothetical protein
LGFIENEILDHRRWRQTGNGETMVFITDHCFQVTSVFRSAPNALNTGVGLQTYCIRDSKEPNGDLFKDLDAYKKLHHDR